MSAVLRVLFLASQWALGSTLERWFGQDSKPDNSVGGLLKTAMFYVAGSLVVIFLFRQFFGKKSWIK